MQLRIPINMIDFPQASTTIMALINSLCAMLRTTPFHRENYARLVLTVIIQFYQRCSDHFQTLITSQASSDRDPRVALGAQWAQIPEIAACLSDLYHASVNRATFHVDPSWLTHSRKLVPTRLGANFTAESVTPRLD